MKANFRAVCWFGVGILLLAPGCETPNPRKPHLNGDTDVSKASVGKPGDDVESTKILDVQSDPSKPRPFFKSSRLSGGLSDEAREIERHVGVQ